MHVNINLSLYLTIKEFGSNKEQLNLLSNLYLIMQPFFFFNNIFSLMLINYWKKYMVVDCEDNK